MSKSILLIHADDGVRKAIRSLLATGDTSLRETGDLSPIEFGSPDVVLIGWQALQPLSESMRWLRQKADASDLRVIVLADRDDYLAAVRSLDFGADDCVLLPLQGDELLVRLEAALRRSHSTGNNVPLVAGPIVLDRRVHRVSVREENVDLAPTEFRLLAFLLENQGRVFSRNELLTRAWASNVKAGHRTVDVHVRRLRQQLEPFDCDAMIQTVRGFGYRLKADEVSATAESA